MFICKKTALILILLFESCLFYAASLLHSGVVIHGYEHSRAATAEGVIGTILAVSVVLCKGRPMLTPLVALSAQSVALAGTLIGAFTIAIGIGPQAPADQIYHAILLTTLTLGILVAWETWHKLP